MMPMQNQKRSRNFRGNGRRPNNNFQPRNNSTFESSGPEGKIRGSAYQVIDRYQALARDALLAGDRVAAENYFQHAEHYHRVLAASGMEPRPTRFEGEGEGQEGDDRSQGDNNNAQNNQPQTNRQPDGQPVGG
ncbi:MAG: DUF4167 domain-containing protein [Alphaproteobacteria bacterium]|nr:DUF4167 domain-containing protein [Alphaproteobacteria bacterium]